MSAPDLSQPQPDPTWAMPQTAQDVSLAVFGGVLVIVVLYAAQLAYRKRTWLPLLLIAGGVLTVTLEPVADTLGNVQHPAVGQVNAFAVDGQPIPWHVVFAFTWSTTLLPLLFFDRFVRRKMPPVIWTRIAIVAFFGAWGFDQLPVERGLWVFYGKQPLDIGWMPMWLAAANAAATVLVAMVVYRLWPLLVGWRALLIVPVLPLTMLGGWLATALPSVMVMNAPPSSVSALELEAAGLMTLGFGAIVARLGTMFAHEHG